MRLCVRGRFSAPANENDAAAIDDAAAIADAAKNVSTATGTKPGSQPAKPGAQPGAQPGLSATDSVYPEQPADATAGPRRWLPAIGWSLCPPSYRRVALRLHTA